MTRDPDLFPPKTDRPPEQACWLDVRPERVFQRGHLPRSVNIPEVKLTDWTALLPRRSRSFGIVGETLIQARRVSGRLQERGWGRGFPSELDQTLCTETGPSVDRLWEPASYLSECEPLLPVEGAAVDLACGSGRNAIFLAEKPRRVLGVDILSDALDLARVVRQHSPQHAGSVRFLQRDLTDARTVQTLLSPARFAVVLCFRYLDRRLLPSILRAIEPGGCLVYETFLAAQREARGKPSHPDHLLHPGELRRAFAGLTLLDYREGVDDDGNHLASLCARRS